MTSNLTPEDRIRRARVQLLDKFPFFGHLAMYLQLNEFSKEEQEQYKKAKQKLTMAVDNNANLYYSPDFVNELSDAELMFVIAHEIMHPANMHFARLGNRNRDVWNIATDLVINKLLVMNNLTPPKGLIDSQAISKYVSIPDPEKYSAEELYDKIYDKVPKMTYDIHIYTMGDGQGKEGQQENIQRQYEDNQWKNRIVEAMSRAKDKGTTPAGISRHVDELINPKLNWKQLLQKYITREIPFDFSWNKPSKRALATGIYMPSVIRESMDLVVTVDTSGSMGNEELKEALGEIVGISKSYPFVNLDIVMCDSSIHRTYKISPHNSDDVMKMIFQGGGGTSHKPVYDWLQKEKPNARLVINLTDGYTDFPKNDNGFRTIWVLTSEGEDEKRIPFGEVLRIHKNGK